MTIAYRGQPVTLTVNLYDPDNPANPLVTTAGVRYKVRDFNKNLIASGVADQNTTDTSQWSLTFTVPKSAPITNVDNAYKVAWYANYSGGKLVERDTFAVRDSSLETPYDPTVVALVGTPFNVSIKTADIPKSMSVRICDAIGNILHVESGIDLTSPISVSDGYIFSVPITDITPTVWQGIAIKGGLATCYSYINYVDAAGNQQTEIYPIYFATMALINLCNDMRQYLDVLRNNDVIAQLRYSEAKLLHFAYQGLLRVNATPPMWVQLSFNMLGHPKGVPYYYWVLKAAQLEILEALTLGEGMTSFEFSGMSVQLNSDRTQYMEAAISRIRNDLDVNLAKSKMQTARSGGFSGNMVTININLGPNTNFVFSGRGIFGLGGGSLLWEGSGIVPLPFFT